MNTHDLVFAVAVALLAGRVLQAQTADGAVTVGRGSLIDWREVRSGAQLDVVDESAADFAQLFVAMVGEEAAAASLEDVPAGPAPREITVFGADSNGLRRCGVRVHGCQVLITPGWARDADAENAAARVVADRISRLAIEEEPS